MSEPAIVKRRGNPHSELVALSDADIVEVAQFVAVQSAKEPAAVEKHLRWFLLENPARDPRIPLGCGLRSAQGELVGCILCVPQAFRFQQQKFSVVWSSCFYVDERYRGNGGLLVFFRFAELGRVWPLCANSANTNAAKFWQVLRAVAIPDSDHELFGVLRWGGMIEEGLSRRGTPKAMAQMIGEPAALFVRPLKRLKLERGRSEDLVALASAEEVMKLPIHDPAPEITADRNLRYLQWRYFSGQDATVAAFAFRNQLVKSGVLVTVNRRPRGSRGQIRTLNVLDVYPAVSPEVHTSIAAALVERYRADIDAIVLRGLDQAKQSVFQRLGFLRRPLDAPNGWVFDKSGLLPSRNWYFVPADGDWLV